MVKTVTGCFESLSTAALLVPAGPDDLAGARQQAPDSLRALLGRDPVRKAVHGSDSHDSAVEELSFFFGSSSSKASCLSGSSSTGTATGGYGGLGGSRGSSAACRAGTSSSGCGQSAAQVSSCCRCCETTLGVVLPHAVKDGIAGLMLEEIQAAFQVTGLQLFNLPKQAAAEFLEVRICLCH